MFDTYVHGWDIAQATGQDAELDPELCAALLEVLPSVAPIVRRGDNFGPEVDVAPDAPVADRMLGVPRAKGLTVEFTRLTETAEYVQRRDELRLAELALVEQQERVAALRRALPPGAVVDDYVFLEGPRDLDAGDDPVREVRLSELFTGPDRALIVYHLMFGKAQTIARARCARCGSTASTVSRTTSSRTPTSWWSRRPSPTVLRAHARDRGWDDLRLLSCGDKHVQVRPPQRGRGRHAGLHGLGVQSRRRRAWSATTTPRTRGSPTTVRERGIDLLLSDLARCST